MEDLKFRKIKWEFHCICDNTYRVGDDDNGCRSFVLEGVWNLTCVLSCKSVWDVTLQ
jgi:hypothetical protein